MLGTTRFAAQAENRHRCLQSSPQTAGAKARAMSLLRQAQQLGSGGVSSTDAVCAVYFVHWQARHRTIRRTWT
jgi:hypothetical protein